MRAIVVGLMGFLLLHAADVSVPLEQQAVRKDAPAFALLDGKGKPVALSKFRGKPVLLDLWAPSAAGVSKRSHTLSTFIKRMPGKG
jgi:hypothetical protein